MGDKMNLIPIIVDKEQNGERSYDIYSRLLKDRIIFLSGEINDETANTIVSELLYLDSINHNDISLYINSPGGSITSGMAIMDTMNYIKSPVSTICIGMAASMAAFLLILVFVLLLFLFLLLVLVLLQVVDESLPQR